MLIHQRSLYDLRTIIHQPKRSGRHILTSCVSHFHFPLSQIKMTSKNNNNDNFYVQEPYAAVDDTDLYADEVTTEQVTADTIVQLNDSAFHASREATQHSCP